MKIHRLKDYKDVCEVLEKKKLPLMYFTQPQMLDNFLNTDDLLLFTIEHEGKFYIFMQKKRTNELRFLFEIFPEDVISCLKKEFKPPYVAYNELIENPHKENQVEDVEAVVDIEKFVVLENKRIRKHYRQAEKENTRLVFKEFKNIPKKDIELFWKTWAEQLSVRELFADRTYNDARFLERYDESQYFGMVAYDEEKIVAYSIGVHHSGTYCLSAFNKALRGYKNLGLQISYEKAKQAHGFGYKKMNLAWIQNDFKKQFIPISKLLTLYGFELCRVEDFKTKSPNGYTGVLLR